MTPGARPRLRWLSRAGWLAAAAALLYFGASAAIGFTRVEFGDETEKLVAALMQGAGGRLYRDVHTQHGPLSYVLPQLLVAALGGELGLRATRVAIALVTAGAAVAIALSPALKGAAARAIATAAFLGAVAPLWLLQALNLGLYHNLAGCLAVVVLAQFTVPVVLGVPVGRGAAFGSGVAAGLVPFAAYSHGPAVVLLALAALVAGRARAPERAPPALFAAFAVGALSGAALVVAWLAAFGDLGGFFVYHFVFNQRIYGRFIGFDWTLPFRALWPSFAPELATRSLAILAAALGVAVLAGRALRAPGAPSRLVALALLSLGLVMLNPRGGFGFAANALVLAALGLAALAAGVLAEPRAPGAIAGGRARSAGAAGAIAAVCLVAASETVSWLSKSSPNWQPRAALLRHRAVLGLADRPIDRLVRAMADPDERVQALVYRPHFYLESGRLPVAAQYYFLPWQAAYERDPVRGYETDLCRDLAERAPPVIFHDDWLVWGRYPFAEYAPCIAKLVEERYVPVALDPQLRIRRDRLIERWRPSVELVPASAAARDALAGQLPGLRALEVELASSPGSCLATGTQDPAAQGAPLVLGDCDAPAARWHALGEGEGTLVLVGGPGALCLEAPGAAGGEGAQAIAARCSGGPAQLVEVVLRPGGDSLRVVSGGLCLVPGAPGGAIEQGPCPREDGPWRVTFPSRSSAPQRSGSR